MKTKFDPLLPSSLLLLASLLFSACQDTGVLPAPPTLEGDWTVTNDATGVVTLLEIDQREAVLTGFWYLNTQSIRVSGDITPSNEFDLTGQANNRTYVFNAEANDGLSRFEGSLSVYDVRGDRVSLQMISGRR